MFQAIATIYIRGGFSLLCSGFGKSPQAARGAARHAAMLRCDSIKPSLVAYVRVEEC